MNEDYCSYELSKALKACGFDEPCDHFYEHSWDPTKARISASGVYGEWNNIDAFKHNFNAIDDNRHKQSLIPYCSAPTLAHAQKWLREKWNIHVYPTLESVNEVVYDCKVVDLRKEAYRLNKCYPNYNQALTEGIKFALELIKKVE